MRKLIIKDIIAIILLLIFVIILIIMMNNRSNYIDKYLDSGISENCNTFLEIRNSIKKKTCNKDLIGKLINYKHINNISEVKFHTEKHILLRDDYLCLYKIRDNKINVIKLNGSLFGEVGSLCIQDSEKDRDDFLQRIEDDENNEKYKKLFK